MLITTRGVKCLRTLYSRPEVSLCLVSQVTLRSSTFASSIVYLAKSHLRSTTSHICLSQAYGCSDRYRHALDAEKYFYAITYDHRLHDSPSDVYQFCMRIGSPFYLGELSPLPVTSPRSQDMSIPTPDAHTDAGSPSNEASNKSDPGKHQDATAVPGSDAAASRPRTFSAYCLQGHLHS